MKELSVLNLALSFIALMAFWLIMSGIYQPVQITQGVISVLIVIAVNYRLKRYKFFEDEMDDLGKLRFHFAIWYVIWLVAEMVKSGFHVALVILSPERRMRTYVLKFKTDLPSAHAKMILGNSITLTPGTLTIDITGDEFTVHAVSEKSFESITSDTMPRMVLRLFEKEERPVVHDLKILNRAEQIKDR